MSFYGFLEKLHMWYHESHDEVQSDVRIVDESYAIYPRRFYGAVDHESERTTDFVFIGGLHTDVLTYTNRKWIIPFIRKHFTGASYLQFTDSNTKSHHEPMGAFDFTFRKKSGWFQKKLLCIYAIISMLTISQISLEVNYVFVQLATRNGVCDSMRRSCANVSLLS